MSNQLNDQTPILLPGPLSIPVPAAAAAMLASACGFRRLPAADGSAQLVLTLRPRGVR